MPDRKSLILVVDDEESNRRLFDAQLKAEGYRVALASSAGQALDMVAVEPPDLMLLDVMMPEMDGFELVARFKSDERARQVPVILVTALDDRDSRLRGLQAGAEDFLTKPVDRAELAARVRNLLKLKEYADFLANYSRVLEEKVLARSRELTESYRETIVTLNRAASYKDEETGAHVQRISFYTMDLAEQLGMGRDFCDNIHYASPMHDVGKIAIPDAILLKPGKFEPDEWEIMKSHSGLGAKLLAGGRSPYLAMGVEIALSHHERWDGGGYPAGLKGEAIPLSARIMNICDQYDALRSKRPYKPAFSHEKTAEIITVGDGRTMPGHFDPQVLGAFKRAAERFRDIYEAHADP